MRFNYTYGPQLSIMNNPKLIYQTRRKNPLVYKLFRKHSLPMYVSRASSKLGSIPLAWRNRTVTKTVENASQANSGVAVNPIFTSENNVFVVC